MSLNIKLKFNSFKNQIKLNQIFIKPNLIKFLLNQISNISYRLIRLLLHYFFFTMN